MPNCKALPSTAETLLKLPLSQGELAECKAYGELHKGKTNQNCNQPGHYLTHVAFGEDFATLFLIISNDDVDSLFF